MLIPFFIVLFPAVWYINRNIMTEQLPPYTEPTTELVVLSTGVAVFSALVLAAVVTFFTYQQNTAEPSKLPYRRRVFQPEGMHLALFCLFTALTGLWFLIDIVGIGPSLLGDVLTVLVALLGLPFLIFAPLAIHFHWAVILGLVLCVLWISLLSSICSDIIHDRPLPILNPDKH